MSEFTSSPEFGEISNSDKDANNGKTVNYLYPGSFSPITGAHKSAVEKLLQLGLFRGYSKVNVYIIPATNQYNKPSIYKNNVGALAPEYLSEEARIQFLESARSLMLIPKDCNVIISKADFNYGAGRYTINNKQSAGLMPTAFLAENYNKKVSVGDSEENLLENPENFTNADTFLILGADNAYTDIVGWGDPRNILANIKILVITRGDKPTNSDRLVSMYYEPNKGKKKSFAEVVAERNTIYGDNYDLVNDMEKNYTQLKFVVPEISSSLLRTIIMNQPIKKEDLGLILGQLKENDSTINNDVSTYLTNEDIVKPDKREYIIGLLTPIKEDVLTATYKNNGVLSGGSKNKRRTRRINKKRIKKRRNYSKRR